MAQLYGPPSDGSVIPHELEDAIAADLTDDSRPIGAAAAGRFIGAVDVPDMGPGIGYAGPDGVVSMAQGPDGTIPDIQIPALAAKITAATPVPDRPLDSSMATFRPLPTDGVSTRSASILNQANKYLMGTWIPNMYGSGTTALVTFLGSGEGQIRPPAAAAVSLAAAVATGTHDATVVGRSVGEVRAQAIRLSTSLANLHVANSPLSGARWGGPAGVAPPTDWSAGWQSALWAFYAGTAAWLVWGDLTDSQRQDVAAMVRHEANRMLRWRLPYWKDLSGAEVTLGDSKSEEVAWDASIVGLAALMMPSYEEAPRWVAKLVEMGFAAHSTPEDVTSGVTVHGFTGADILAGWNANSDGTIVNHDRIHPDYMVSAGSSLWGIIPLYAANGIDVPAAVVHNTSLIYSSLSSVEFTSPPYEAPGGTIYVAGSADMYYPQGNDWGTHRLMDKALMDVLAARYGWDDGLTTTATTWAELHLQRQVEYQARGTTGQTYQAAGEDTYNGREQWVGANAAFAVLAMCAPVPKFSSAVPDILVSRNKRRW